MRRRSERALTNAGYEAVARTFQVLSEPVRLKILDALQKEPLNVSALVLAVDKSQANVSKHLSILREAGLVRRRQDGSQAIYEIADPLVFKLCELVCGGLETRLRSRREAYFG